MYKRRRSREVSVGNVKIGGNNPISIQSMTNTDTRDAKATIAQIKRLESVGCDIVRVAIPDMTAAKNIAKIKSQVNIPIIADIHFDYRLALEVIDQGVDGVRINPGNIGSIDRVKMVVEKCKEKNLKIRIGVNGGSLEKELLEKYGSATPEALVESALNHVKILEDLDFRNIAISLKSSDIYKTLDAYELISKKVDYPLHIGITESGSVKKGTIKSSIGVGALLLKGIGDTISLFSKVTSKAGTFVSKFAEASKETGLFDKALGKVDLGKFSKTLGTTGTKIGGVTGTLLKFTNGLLSLNPVTIGITAAVGALATGVAVYKTNQELANSSCIRAKACSKTPSEGSADKISI